MGPDHASLVLLAAASCWQDARLEYYRIRQPMMFVGGIFARKYGSLAATKKFNHSG